MPKRDIEREMLETQEAPTEPVTQWVKGTWSGIEMWTCSICQWSTLNGIEAARAYQAACLKCSKEV